jgi:hypothetical protein
MFIAKRALSLLKSNVNFIIIGYLLNMYSTQRQL